MITCVGTEEVTFTEALILLGKVEIYLQFLIDTMRKTLKDIANASIKAKPQMERRAWIERDPA